MKCFMVFSFFAFTFLACSSPAISVLTKEIRPSNDSTYGYTCKNPIRVGYYNFFESMNAQSYLLRHFRGSNNGRLRMLYAASVGCGSDDIIDLYKLVPEGTSDTLYLYMDVNTKGPLMIPRGLTFDHSEQ